MSKKIEKAKVILNDTGHKVDNFVEEKSEKHGFTKFQVLVGLLIAGVAVVAVVKWVL